MVNEIRKIILSKDELAMALQAYRRVDPGYIPSGKILTCEVRNDQEIVLKLEMDQDSPPPFATRLFTLLPSKLTMPIVHFCLDNRIMLPRRGKKSAMLAQGFPLLFIELDTHPIVDFDR